MSIRSPDRQLRPAGQRSPPCPIRWPDRTGYTVTREPEMNNTVLLIAYHLPPAAMGSGHLRTLGCSRYLPASGWHPVVLSARAMAYPHTAPVDDALIPENCPVHRALAFDARRHFGIAGKYPGVLAQPDRWRSWWPAAVLQGLRLIRRHRVRAIW